MLPKLVDKHNKIVILEKRRQQMFQTSLTIIMLVPDSTIY